MDKAAIQLQVKDQSDKILSWIRAVDDDLLNLSKDSKWSIAENAIHLVKSVAPINIALSLPKFTFLVFGRADFSRDFDEVVAHYKTKLTKGAKASGPYIPRSNNNQDRDKLISSFSDNYKTLIDKLGHWSEDDLDKYRLPHPILGKLTIREMLYFTIYHLEHHYKAMKMYQID